MKGKHVQPGLPMNLAWLRRSETINLHEKIFDQNPQCVQDQSNWRVPVVWNNALLMSFSHVMVACRLLVGLKIYILVSSYFAMALRRWISKLYGRKIEKNGSTSFSRILHRELGSIRAKAYTSLHFIVLLAAWTLKDTSTKLHKQKAVS